MHEHYHITGIQSFLKKIFSLNVVTEREFECRSRKRGKMKYINCGLSDYLRYIERNIAILLNLNHSVIF